MNGRKRLRTLVALIALLGALALGTGACSSKSKANDASSSTTAGASSTTTAALSAMGQTIEIKDFAFHDAKLTVARGAKVTVSNKDSTVHTLTADGKAFDTGNVAGGASATLDLSTPGTFTYHCAIHNYMTGQITVTG